MAYVRPYSPNDLHSCVRVFNETADSSLHFEPGLTIGSYLWCRPYLHLSPSACFVLDDGSGQAVGYCIGTPDTAKFCQEWRSSYLPTLSRESDASVFSPAEEAENQHSKVTGLLDSLWNDIEGGCNGSVDGLWDVYPGHLHIDILPSHQRHGYGPLLVQSLIGQLAAKTCRGVHMGVVASNFGALKFYERSGFERFTGTADEGEVGRKGGTVIMVKKLVGGQSTSRTHDEFRQQGQPKDDQSIFTSPQSREDRYEEFWLDPGPERNAFVEHWDADQAATKLISWMARSDLLFNLADTVMARNMAVDGT